MLADGSAGVGRVARTLARALLWAAVALVAVRGVQAVLTGPRDRERERPARTAGSAWPDREARTLAVRFARVFMTVAPGRRAARARSLALGRLMAGELGDQAAVTPPHRPGVTVAQATVAREAGLGGSRALITVAVSLSDGQARYLSVPVARDAQRRVVVDDLPSLTAPPAAGTASAREWVALTGPDAGAIAALARRFLVRYVSGRPAAELGYLLAPGAQLAPLPAGLRVVAVAPVLEPAASGDRGPVRDVAALVRVRDPGFGVVLSLRYRLRVLRRGRWYVAAVAGGPTA